MMKYLIKQSVVPLVVAVLSFNAISAQTSTKEEVPKEWHLKIFKFKIIIYSSVSPGWFSDLHL